MKNLLPKKANTTKQARYKINIQKLMALISKNNNYF